MTDIDKFMSMTTAQRNSAMRKDLTAPTRKAKERQRKREAGLVPVEVWVHKTKREELRAMAGYLTTPRV